MSVSAIQYGLTPQGFQRKPQTEIVAELEAAFQTAYGAGVPVNVQSRNGQTIVIFSTFLDEAWGLAQGVYSSQDPDQAVGVQLDDVVSLTGTRRKVPTPSVAVETLTGTPGTVVQQGSIVAVPASGVRFDTAAPATIAAVPTWLTGTTYAQGNRTTNVGNVYQMTALTGISSGGPTGTGSAIVDGSCVWRYLGPGTGAVDVNADSELDGPIEASSGSLTQIITPVLGWAGAVNVLDAVLGTNVESDANLRADQANELAADGLAAQAAIQAQLEKVAGVLSVVVNHNDGDSTDGNGLPPHSVEAIVHGGATQDVLNALFAAVGTGINTHGNTTGTVTDSEGVVHTLSYTVPTPVNIYVVVNLTYDASLYPGVSAPTPGDTLVKDNVLAYGDALPSNYNVFASKIVAAIQSGIPGTLVVGVPGVLDVTVLIGTAPAPGTSTPVSISIRQIAAFDTSRVTVNSTPGTP